MISVIQRLPPADIFKAAEWQFRADVLRGLRAPKKELPCKYFYDEVCAALFEQITELDEYYPTRTELGIMERHAAEMAELLGPRCLLIEYGSGSSTLVWPISPRVTRGTNGCFLDGLAALRCCGRTKPFL
jgi:uncharacterized SAM-dependent methyltransferase